ncbi:MAG: SOS response-associated peptidase [Bacteroidota bacterium]
MCGRYVVVSKVTEIEERFNVKAAGPVVPNFNLGPGSRGPVITNDQPKVLQFFQFGMTPFWAKKKMYLFNARSEGDQNKENDPNYRGAKGIISKPAFRKSIRSKRCLVIADCFIEGTTQEKLNKPFLVHLEKDQRPFAFAGIWDEWVDQSTGEVVQSYSIITTTPTPLLQKLPHHRSPVILSKKDEAKWLDSNADLMEITALLKPYEGYMNAYPITTEIKNPRNNNRSLIEPQGKSLIADKKIVVDQKIVLEGMGFSRARSRRN